MSKHSLPQTTSDFNDVLEYLKSRGIVPGSYPGTLEENARKIHKFTYSLILWRFRLKGLPEHSQVFIEEIASDALQILPQALMGYGKTAKLLTRGIVENTIRHLYFSDHPIEFTRMNRDAKWYMAIEDLFDYAKKHPALSQTECKFDALNKLNTLYSELSAGIHGRRVQDLEMRVALNKIAYDEAAAKAQASFIERCAEAANFLLAIFHADKFSLFQVEDRRIILRAMPARARQICRDIA